MRTKTESEQTRKRALDFRNQHPELIREMEVFLDNGVSWYEVPVSDDGLVGLQRQVSETCKITAGNILVKQVNGIDEFMVASPQMAIDDSFTEDEKQVGSNALYFWEPGE